MLAELLTVKEAASALKISTDRVYDMVANGDLPKVQFGAKTIRVPKDGVSDFIRRHTTEGTNEKEAC